MKVLGKSAHSRPDRVRRASHLIPDPVVEREIAGVRRTAFAEEPFGRLAGLAAMMTGAVSASVLIAQARPAAQGWRVAAGTVPGGRGDLAGESLCRYVVESGEPLLIHDASPAPPAGAGLPAGRNSVIAWAGFPVRDASGCAIGALCVADDLPRQWASHDIEILTTLAAVASREAALQVIEEHQDEHAELVRTLQESLLPQRLPAIPGLDVAASYEIGGGGAEVLGDFYDVFPSVRGHWGVVVGDVCGKGVPAAKTTALARYTLRAHAFRQSRPSAILAGLNQALLGWDTDDKRFLTAIYATVRPIQPGALVRVSAGGHPLALVRAADGTVRTLGQPGTLLGLVAHPELRDTRQVLRPGDSLVMFTDGVTEARSHLDRQLFGEERLEHLLAGLAEMPAERMADAILESARSHCGGIIPDDTVVMVIKVPSSQGRRYDSRAVA
jgi:sigma-B regulation protein RsbU (phosphoserine phosphatase)